MKILAVIPARGGSKRLPRKNIKDLGGLPLIGWTIRAALASESCVDVLVSTDNKNIAEVARQCGASVPWLRPAELATDTATSIDVVIHAVDAYEEVNGAIDGVLLLQPTSPFRSMETIKRGIAFFDDIKGGQAIVSVSPARSNPAWCFRCTGSNMHPLLGWEGINMRSQDIEPVWELNGALYLISPAKLRANRTFIMPGTHPLKMVDMTESIDVDTEEDFIQCQTILDNSPCW